MTEQPLSAMCAALAAALLSLALAGAVPGASRSADRLLRAGQLESAQRRYRDFLDAHPDDARAERAALRIAEIDYELGREEAARRFREWIARYGYADTDGRGRYGLAESLYAAGDLEGARVALRELLEGDARPGSPYRPLAEVRLAWVRFREGDIREAKTRFARVAAVFGESSVGLRARWGLAACAFIQGDYRRAFDLYGEVADSDAPDWLASIAKTGRAVSAVRLSEGGLGADTLDMLDTPLARAEALRLAADRGDPDAALAILDGAPLSELLLPEGASLLCLAGDALAASNAAPETPVGRLALAERLFSRSELAPAREAFHDLADDAEGSIAAFAGIRAGECAERLQRPGEARAAFERALDRLAGDAPLAARGLLGAARACLAAGRAEDALAFAGRLEDAFPARAQQKDAALVVAIALVANGHPGRAERALNDVAALATEDSDAFRTAVLWRARGLADLGRHEESAAEYRAYLGAGGDTGSARLELMDALLRAGALATNTEALLASLADADNETRAAAHRFAARARERAEEYGEAAGLYAEARRLADGAKTEAAFVVKEAECLWRAGEPDLALALLAYVAVDGAAEVPGATLKWAAAQSNRRGRPDRAIAFLSAFLEAEPSDKAALSLLARCLAQEERWEECIAVAARLLEDAEGTDEARAAALDRAEALIRVGRPEEARRALARLADSGVVRAEWLRGEAYLAEGRFERAAEAYRAPLDAHGESLRASWAFRLYKGLGEARLGAGDTPGAIEAMRRAVALRLDEPALEVARVRLSGELNRLTAPR